MECLFGGGESFKHFDLKWMDFGKIEWVAVEDKILQEKLKEVTRRIFLGMNGVSYGRVDLRMDAKGDVYFLEMNPNCGIFYATEDIYGSADIILKNDPIGHTGFL